MASTGMSFMLCLMVFGSRLLLSQADNDAPSPSCVEGSNGCLRCVKDGSCAYCDIGYVFDTNSKPTTCSRKPGNSLLFSVDSPPAVSCDPRCASGCSDTGAGHCDEECDAGFVLVDNKCKSCDSNCDPSSGCSQAGKCDSKCIFGYTLRDNTCKACSLHCKSGCDTEGASKCDLECEHGWALSSDKHCFACDENCDTTAGGCSEPFSCDGKCKAGYTTSTASNGLVTCQPCHVYCAGTCDKAGAFRCDKDQCQPGYTTCQKTNTCRPCGAGCDTTVGCNKAGPNRCDKCRPGYKLDDNIKVCFACDPNCDPASGCSNAGGNKCDGQCKSGYRLGTDSKCYVSSDL